MNSTIECGICGCDRAESLLPGTGVVLRCGDCGVGYTAEQLQPEAEDLFDERYYGGYFTRAEQWRYEANRRLQWLLQQIRPRKLMEIGCAGGFFVQAARESGIAAIGIDLSPKATVYARETLGVPVHTGRFEELRRSERFDAVCAFHVLEHVEHPTRFLHATSDCLERGGILALEVPNITSARARRARQDWADLQPDRHRWHFSPHSLKNVVERAGFQTRQLNTVSRRVYMRRREILTRPGATLLAQDLLATRSPNITHPEQGDYLRLLAVKQ